MSVKRVFIGTLAAAFVAMGVSSALSAPNAPLAAPNSTCADTLQNKTLGYVNAVQKEIRKAIKANATGKDVACNGGLACAGGPNNGFACTQNTECCVVNMMTNPTCNNFGVIDDLKDPFCTSNPKKGVTANIIKAKGKLRVAVGGGAAPKCTSGMMTALGYPNSRCFDPTDLALNKTIAISLDKVLDCILQGAIGDIVGGKIGDPAGEIMARAATDIVADSLIVDAVSIVCPVTLGSDLQVGVTDFNPPSIAQAGGATPNKVGTCSGGVCSLEGMGFVGNILTVTSNPGTLPTCLTTITTGVPPGFTLPGVGSIDLSGPDPGLQTSSAPILTTVLIGLECPKCTAEFHTCDSGANVGAACNNAGDDDPICVPTLTGTESQIPNPFTLSTEAITLSAPITGPGVSNPFNAMCGACDGDTKIGCQNNADCDTPDIGDQCIALNCCQFNSNKGAFGDTLATQVIAQGKRGPYVAQIAGAFCTGKTGAGLDALVGLPGPVRLTQAQLNTFNYKP